LVETPERKLYKWRSVIDGTLEKRNGLFHGPSSGRPGPGGEYSVPGGEQGRRKRAEAVNGGKKTAEKQLRSKFRRALSKNEELRGVDPSL